MACPWAKTAFAGGMYDSPIRGAGSLLASKVWSFLTSAEAKVVVHVKQRNHRDVIVDLFRESIGQTSEAPHVHSHVEILPFDVAGRHVSRIGIANDSLPESPKTLRRAVALLSLRIVAVDLHQLRVIDIAGEASITDMRYILWPSVVNWIRFDTRAATS